jgi:hypothetical protein
MITGKKSSKIDRDPESKIKSMPNVRTNQPSNPLRIAKNNKLIEHTNHANAFGLLMVPTTRNVLSSPANFSSLYMSEKTLNPAN